MPVWLHPNVSKAVVCKRGCESMRHCPAIASELQTERDSTHCGSEQGDDRCGEALLGVLKEGHIRYEVPARVQAHLRMQRDAQPPVSWTVPVSLSEYILPATSCRTYSKRQLAAQQA